ncbi:LOW QUALITY PROTEIN: uncharacterized protein EMH_0058480 [Eimeria mitis]|uniref:Uncharacterized protein n=1 Tax=Eimeria mitis TaxID=44415 RepID=U6K3Y5_9EIME|nr:LOW QUALITY PROTEIN: uncharacterized protein EMH_0058480 [Eimeria mitis]CDJ30468.1 hypothetical protein, conserved [Eimeria mitis]
MSTESAASDSLLYDPLLSNHPISALTEAHLSDTESVLAGPASLSTNLSTAAHSIDEGLSTEADQKNAVSISRRSQNVQEQLRGSSTAVSVTALVIWFSLGLFVFQSLRASDGSQKQELHPQKKQRVHLQPKQGRENRQRGSRGKLLHQLDELLQLQAVAVQLAETTQNHESHLALHDFRESLERAKRVKKLLEDSSSPWKSPDNVMEKALHRGFSALSHLYEASRQHGLTLAREALDIQPAREFSVQELKIMESYLGSPVVEAIENHMNSLKLSCRAFAWKLEETATVLENLPRLEKVEDGVLLDAIAAHLNFVKAVHEAATVGRQSAQEVASSAVAVTLSQLVRNQMNRYRECRDLMEERRAMCREERERHESPTKEGTVNKKELETVELLLKRGEQLLSHYHGDIEELQKERDIELAEAARVQTEDLGKELKVLLDVAFARMNVFPEAATQNKKVEDAYKATLDWFSPMVGEEQGQDRPPSKKLLNQGMLNLLTGSLWQTENNAKSACQQAGIAATAISLGSEAGAPGRDLMAAARRAAATAESLVGSAEVLWLHAQLLESLECDLRMSVNLAQVGAARAGLTETPTHEQRQWVVELSEPHRLHVEALERDVETAKNLARTHWSARDVALSASTMKNAAVGIASFVQQQQLKQAVALIP